MTTLWEFFLRYGYLLLFAAVFVEQAGAPVPAVPALLVMGALAGLGHYSIAIALLVAVIASVIADFLWYELGRRRGESVLGVLCRLSLEQDSCVRRTSNSFERWGPTTLLFAKFIPGFSTLAPPMAGTGGVSPWRFIMYDSLGSALWAGSAIGIGALLSHQVERVIEWLPQFGYGLFAVLAGLLAIWIGWKFWQRHRALASLHGIARITPDELRSRLDSNQETWVVDARAQDVLNQARTKIPGAFVLNGGPIDARLKDMPTGAHLVFYCT